MKQINAVSEPGKPAQCNCGARRQNKQCKGRQMRGFKSHLVVEHTDFISSTGGASVMSPSMVLHGLAHVTHPRLTHGRCPMHGSGSR